MANGTKKTATRTLLLALCAVLTVGLLFGVGPFKGVTPTAEAAGNTNYVYTRCTDTTLATGRYVVIGSKSTSAFGYLPKQAATSNGTITYTQDYSSLPSSITLTATQANTYEWYITKNSDTTVQFRNSSSDQNTLLMMDKSNNDLVYGTNDSTKLRTWTYGKSGSFYRFYGNNSNSVEVSLGPNTSLKSDGNWCATTTGNLYNSGYNVALYKLSSTTYDINTSVNNSSYGSVTVKNSSGTTITKAAAGDVVTITTTPSSGYYLSSLYVYKYGTTTAAVTPTATTAGTTYTFTMPSEPVTVTATFSSGYNITRSSSTNGTVGLSWTGTNRGGGTLAASTSSGTLNAPSGTTVTVTTTPNANYKLKSLTVTNNSTGKAVSYSTTTAGSKYTFTMPSAAVTVTATYGYAYTITRSASTNGTVAISVISGSLSASTSSGTLSAAAGATVTVTTTPNANYKLKSLTITNTTAGTTITPTIVTRGSSYTFTMPSGNVTVTATYGYGRTITLGSSSTYGTYSATDPIYGTLSTYGGTLTVAEGSVLTLSASVSSSYPYYQFSGWSRTGSYGTFANSSSTSTTFTVGGGNTTLTANFSLKAAGGVRLYQNGTTTTPAQSAGNYSGGTYTLPSSVGSSLYGTDWTLEGWIVNSNSYPSTNSYTSRPSTFYAAGTTVSVTSTTTTYKALFKQTRNNTTYYATDIYTPFTFHTQSAFTDTAKNSYNYRSGSDNDFSLRSTAYNSSNACQSVYYRSGSTLYTYTFAGWTTSSTKIYSPQSGQPATYYEAGYDYSPSTSTAVNLYAVYYNSSTNKYLTDESFHATSSTTGNGSGTVSMTCTNSTLNSSTATSFTSGTTNLKSGSTITVNLSSASGSRFKSITVKNARTNEAVPYTTVTAGEEYYFTLPTDNVTVSVEYELVRTVTIEMMTLNGLEDPDGNPISSIVVSGGGESFSLSKDHFCDTLTVPVGDTVTVTYTPAAHCPSFYLSFFSVSGYTVVTPTQADPDYVKPIVYSFTVPASPGTGNGNVMFQINVESHSQGALHLSENGVMTQPGREVGNYDEGAYTLPSSSSYTPAGYTFVGWLRSTETGYTYSGSVEPSGLIAGGTVDNTITAVDSEYYYAVYKKTAYDYYQTDVKTNLYYYTQSSSSANSASYRSDSVRVSQATTLRATPYSNTNAFTKLSYRNASGTLLTYDFCGWTDSTITEPTANPATKYDAGASYTPTSTDSVVLRALYSYTADGTTTYLTDESYGVTSTKSGTGSGQVVLTCTNSPLYGAANASVSASTKLRNGSTIQVTLAPGTGSQLTSFSFINARTNQPITNYTTVSEGYMYRFTLPTDDVIVQAVFDKVWTVSLGSPAHGTISAASPSISEGGSAAVAQGSEVSLSAVPDYAYYRFDGWSISSGTAGSFTDASAAGTSFTVGAGDATITASFVLKDQAGLRLSANGQITVPTVLEGNYVGGRYTLPTTPSYTPTSMPFVFEGWVTEEIPFVDTTRPASVTAGGTTISVTASTGTYYALYSIYNSDYDMTLYYTSVSYGLTYTVNGQRVSDTSGWTEQGFILEGTTFDLPDVDDLTAKSLETTVTTYSGGSLDTYSFVGWANCDAIYAPTNTAPANLRTDTWTVGVNNQLRAVYSDGTNYITEGGYTVTVSYIPSGNTVSISPNGGAYVGKDETVTLNVTPAAGRCVASASASYVSGADSIGNPTYSYPAVTVSGNTVSFTMPAANTAVRLTMEYVQYTGTFYANGVQVAAVTNTTTTNIIRTPAAPATDTLSYFDPQRDTMLTYSFAGWIASDAEITSPTTDNYLIYNANSNAALHDDTTFRAVYYNSTSRRYLTAVNAFDVVCAPASNGTVSASPNSGVQQGQTVTVTLTPDSGFGIATVTAVDASSSPVTVTGSGSSRSFTMPASDVTVTAVFGTLRDLSFVADSTALNSLAGTVIEGGTATLPTEYQLARAGGSTGLDRLNSSTGRLEYYIFCGWTESVITAPTATQPADYVVGGGSYTGGSADATLHALYQYTDDSTGTIYYITEGGHDVNVTATHASAYVFVNNRNVSSCIGAGESFTVRVMPASGYSLVNVTATDANGTPLIPTSVTPNGSYTYYTFTMPTSEVSVIVTAGELHNLSFVANSATIGSLAATVPEGGAQTLPTSAQVGTAGGATTIDRYNSTAAETETFSLVGWSADVITVPTATQPDDFVAAGDSYTGGSADATLHAVYACTSGGTTYYLTESGNDVTVNAVQHATVTVGPNGGSDIGAGDSFTVTVTPDAGYGLVGDPTVTDGSGTPLVPTGVTQSGGSTVYTYTMPGSDVSVTVPIAAEHDLSFVANGTTLGSLAEAVPEGATTTLPTLAQVGAAGGDTTIDRYNSTAAETETFTLVGWSASVITTPTATQPGDFVAVGGSYTGGSADATLHAVYTATVDGTTYYLTEGGNDVTVNAIQHATVTVGPNGGSDLGAGESFTVTVTSDAGYGLSGDPTVTDGSGTPLVPTGVTQSGGSTVYTYTMSASDVSVSVPIAAEHELSFVVNGTTVAGLAEAVPEGATITLPTAAQVGDAGGDTTIALWNGSAEISYSLVGWSASEITVPTPTRPGDFAAVGGSYTGGSSDATLHAVYSATVDGTTYYLTEGGRDVSVGSAEHVSVAVSPNNGQNLAEGQSVTVTVTPDAGYEIASVSVTDGNGDPVTVTPGAGGTYTFNMPDSGASVSVSLSYTVYTAAFDANGTALPSLTRSNTASDNTVTMPNIPAGYETLEYYDDYYRRVETCTFYGWTTETYTNLTYIGSASYVEAGDSVALTGNVTYHAMYVLYRFNKYYAVTDSTPHLLAVDDTFNASYDSVLRLDVLANDILGDDADAAIIDVNDSYDLASIAPDGKSILFELPHDENGQVPNLEGDYLDFGYYARLGESGNVSYGSVKVYVSDAVYYEDSSSLFTYTNGTRGKWTDSSGSTSLSTGSALIKSADQIGLGCDPALSDVTWSGDSYRLVTAGTTADGVEGSTDTWPSMTFTFTGSAFELYARRNRASGMLRITVDGETLNVATAYGASGAYDPASANGGWSYDGEDDYYGMPVYFWGNRNDNSTPATHTVTVECRYIAAFDPDKSDSSYSVGIDGVRIYNAYVYTGPIGPIKPKGGSYFGALTTQYISFRDTVISANTLGDATRSLRTAQTYDGTNVLYVNLHTLMADGGNSLNGTQWWTDNDVTQSVGFKTDGGAYQIMTLTKVTDDIYKTYIPAGNWTKLWLLRGNPEDPYNTTGDMDFSGYVEGTSNLVKNFWEGGTAFTWDSYAEALPTQGAVLVNGAGVLNDSEDMAAYLTKYGAKNCLLLPSGGCVVFYLTYGYDETEVEIGASAAIGENARLKVYQITDVTGGVVTGETLLDRTLTSSEDMYFPIPGIAWDSKTGDSSVIMVRNEGPTPLRISNLRVINMVENDLVMRSSVRPPVCMIVDAEAARAGAAAVQALNDGTFNETPVNPTDPVEPVEGEIVLRGNSISLNGQIDVNFYVDVPAELLAAGVYATLDGARAELTEGTYGTMVTKPLPAKEMNVKVTLRFYAADGTQLSFKSGSETVTEKTYAVQDYLTYVINHADAFEAKLVKLCKAMSDYGACTQKVLGYDAENARPIYLADEIAAVTCEGCAYSASANTASITFAGVSVVTESETALRVYFNLSGESFTATVDGEAAEIRENAKGTYVELSGIAAKDLGTAHVFALTNGSETVTVSDCSVYSYVWSVLGYAGASEELTNAAKALKLYGDLAAAYFGEER